jgi:hypothetical protein
LVWPHDATRKLIWQSGLDRWFWIHVGQTVLFGAIAIWAFTKLARVMARNISAEGDRKIAAI